MPGRPAFSNIHNEVKSMDINKLKAEHQDVYQAIKKEGGDEREAAIKQTFIDQGWMSAGLRNVSEFPK